MECIYEMYQVKRLRTIFSSYASLYPDTVPSTASKFRSSKVTKAKRIAYYRIPQREDQTYWQLLRKQHFSTSVVCLSWLRSLKMLLKHAACIIANTDNSPFKRSIQQFLFKEVGVKSLKDPL